MAVSGIIATILGAVVKPLIDGLRDWYESWKTKEESKAFEWAAHARKEQLRSVKDANAVQLRIREAVKPEDARAKDPKAWNAGYLR